MPQNFLDINHEIAKECKNKQIIFMIVKLLYYKLIFLLFKHFLS